MKSNPRDALTAGDFARLERAFSRIASFAMPEYPAWAAIAERGSSVAASGDVDAVRKACKDCHEAYRPAYRRDHRTRSLP
jgi:hypothetical protein